MKYVIFHYTSEYTWRNGDTDPSRFDSAQFDKLKDAGEWLGKEYHKGGGPPDDWDIVRLHTSEDIHGTENEMLRETVSRYAMGVKKRLDEISEKNRLAKKHREAQKRQTRIRQDEMQELKRLRAKYGDV